MDTVKVRRVQYHAPVKINGTDTGNPNAQNVLFIFKHGVRQGVDNGYQFPFIRLLQHDGLPVPYIQVKITEHGLAPVPEDQDPNGIRRARWYPEADGVAAHAIALVHAALFYKPLIRQFRHHVGYGHLGHAHVGHQFHTVVAGPGGNQF